MTHMGAVLKIASRRLGWHSKRLGAEGVIIRYCQSTLGPKMLKLMENRLLLQDFPPRSSTNHEQRTFRACSLRLNVEKDPHICRSPGRWL